MKHMAERTSADGGPFGDAGSPEERVPSSRTGEGGLVVDWTDEASSERAELIVDWTGDDGAPPTEPPSCIDWTETEEASGVRRRLELPWQPLSDPAPTPRAAAPPSPRAPWAPPLAAPDPGVLRADPRTPIPPGWPVAPAARNDDPDSRPTWPTGAPVPPATTTPIAPVHAGAPPPIAGAAPSPSIASESVARPLATHVPEELDVVDDLPFDLFGHPPPEEEPVTWPVDPEVERLWNARRGRRAFVRGLGWALVALSIAGLGHLAMTSEIGAEIAYFATMGAVDDGSRAGRVVRANVLEDKIEHVEE